MEEKNIDNTEYKATENASVLNVQGLGVPVAIVIAGLAIAAAIFFGGKGGNAPSVTTAPSKPAVPVAVDPVTTSDHILGNPNAKVIIVEYSDTECPFCKSFHPTLSKIMNEYGKDGKVAWVYRHFPLPFHSRAPHEAEATECANKIGGNSKFWEYLDRIYEITPGNNQLDPAELPKIAKFIGLDEVAFNKCLSGGEMKAIVESNLQSGIKAGVQGTPFSIILVNNKVIDTINGAQPYEVVKTQFQQALK